MISLQRLYLQHEQASSISEDEKEDHDKDHEEVSSWLSEEDDDENGDFDGIERMSPESLKDFVVCTVTRRNRLPEDDEALNHQDCDSLDIYLDNYTYNRKIKYYITDDNIEMIFSEIQQHYCCRNTIVSTRNFDHLHTLNLSNNKIGDHGCNVIYEFLINNDTKKLRGLWLASNSITDIGIESIANSLTNNQTLEHLGLSDNKIGNNGCLTLASLFQTNKSIGINDLWLGSNSSIDDVGCKALSELLNVSKTLALLELNDNDNITQKGLSMLLNSLQNNNTTLTYLNFDHYPHSNAYGHEVDDCDEEYKAFCETKRKVEFYLALNKAGRHDLLLATKKNHGYNSFCRKTIGGIYDNNTAASTLIGPTSAFLNNYDWFSCFIKVCFVDTLSSSDNDNNGIHSSSQKLSSMYYCFRTNPELFLHLKVAPSNHNDTNRNNPKSGETQHSTLGLQQELLQRQMLIATPKRFIEHKQKRQKCHF